MSAIGRALFKSRQRLREKVAKLRTRLEESEAEQRRVEAELERARAAAERQAARIAELERELKCQRTERAAVALPEDPPLPRHQYGPKMISLCVNLAQRVGFRPTVAVLKIFLSGWESRSRCRLGRRFGVGCSAWE
jgi:septal ring factor EnvC (AmiA/AmiB activator)